MALRPAIGGRVSSARVTTHSKGLGLRHSSLRVCGVRARVCTCLEIMLFEPLAPAGSVLHALPPLAVADDTMPGEQ